MFEFSKRKMHVWILNLHKSFRAHKHNYSLWSEISHLKFHVHYVCCHNLNKIVCDFVVCDCLYASVLMKSAGCVFFWDCFFFFFFSVTSAVSRSLAVCQPSKACYVIKDFLCVVPSVGVCVCLSCIGSLQGLSWSPVCTEGSIVAAFLHLQRLTPWFLLLFYSKWKWQGMYGDARRDIRASKASVTSFHPPSRSFSSEPEPGPAHRHPMGRGLREGALDCISASCFGRIDHD